MGIRWSRYTPVIILMCFCFTVLGGFEIPDDGWIGSYSEPNALRIDSSGNILMSQELSVTGDVGIGTTSPDSPLHIFKSGTAVHAYFKVETVATGNSNAYMILDSANKDTYFDFYSGGSKRWRVGNDLSENHEFFIMAADSDKIMVIEQNGDIVMSQDLTVTGIITGAEFNTTGFTGSAGTLGAFGVDGASLAFPGLFEVGSDTSHVIPSTLSTAAGITGYFDAGAAHPALVHYGARISVVAQGTIGGTFSVTKEYNGLFGGASSTVINNGSRNLTLFGLQFSAVHNADWTKSGGPGTADLETCGLKATGRFGAGTFTINGETKTENCGGRFVGDMGGTYDADNDGLNYGVYAETINSFEDIGAGVNVNSYGVYIDAADSAVLGSGGTLTSWSLYSVNDVDSFIKGDLFFGQTDGAERIASDADGTLDLYAGTSIDLHTNLINLGLGTAADVVSQWVTDGGTGTFHYDNNSQQFEFADIVVINNLLFVVGDTDIVGDLLVEGDIALTTSGAAANLALSFASNGGTGRITWLDGSNVLQFEMTKATFVGDIDVEGEAIIGERIIQQMITQTFSGSKTLTDGAATGFVEIAIATGEFLGGNIIYSIYVSGSGDFQSHSGEVSFVALNKAGTVESDIEEQYLPAAEAEIRTAGSLTDDFTITDGANKITINCDAATTLGSPTLTLKYTITMHSLNTITAL